MAETKIPIIIDNDITNARLLEVEREQRELAEALREVGAALNATLDFNTVLDRLLDQVSRVTPYDTGNVFLLDQGIARVVRTRGHEKFGVEIARAAAALSFNLATTPNLRQMAESKEPLLISDTSTDRTWLKGEAWGHVRSWVGAPIVAQGQVIAFFSLDKTEPGFYQARHVEHLAVFAGQAALALENARLFEAEARRRREAETLREAAAALTSALDLEQVLDNILTYLEQVIPYDSASVFLLEGNSLRAVAGRGLPLQKQVIGQDFPVDADDPFLDTLKRTHQPLYLPNAQLEPQFKRWGDTHYIRGWMAVPLVVREHLIGYVTLDSRQVAAYGPIEADLAQAFANQAAIAIENARLFQAAQSARRLSDSLREIGASLAATLDPNEVMNRVLDSLGKVVTYDSASIMLKEGEAFEVKAGRGLPPNTGGLKLPFRFQESELHQQLYQSKEPIIIPDVQQDPRWIKIAGDEYIRSWLTVPLLVRDKVIGALNLDKCEPGFYTEAHVFIVSAFAQHAAIALDNAHLFDKTRRQAKQLEALHQIMQDLTALRDLDTLLRQIVEHALQLLDAQGGNVFMYRPERQVLELVVALGQKAGPVGLIFRPGEGLSGTVWNTGQPLIVEDFQHWPGKAGAWADIPGLAVVGAPIRWGNETLGVLSIFADNTQRHFTSEDAALLAQFAAQAAIAIENARLYEQVQRHAAELEIRVAERTFELEVLYELTQALGQATQLGDVIRLILLHLYRTIPHDVAASLLVTESVNTLVIQSQRPLSAQVEADIQEIMGAVLDQPLVKALEVRRIQPKTETAIRPPLEDLASMMQVPIVIDEVPVGLLLIATERSNQFTQEQVRLLRTIANQASESIQRLQLLLAAEYHRLESLVAHLPDGIILLNSELRIVLANQTAQKFLTVLTPAAPGDQLTYLGHQPVGLIIALDTIGLPREVESINFPRQLFEVAARPIAVGPEAGGWILVIREVTAERAAQERVQQQDRLAAVGQLAAGIAHDFNNILTSMIGFAELARLDPHIPPTVSEDLQRIIQQGQRAAALIRQILDFSRQSITEKRPIDLAAFLKETIKLLERTIPEDIRIVLEIEPNSYDAYTFNGDPTQIQQVLANLAVNARDAMPVGGVMHFRLTHFTLNPGEQPPYPEMSPGPWILLSISDTGVGISPEALPRIFEPFFTTKEVGKGTGLGLAQVYGIITQHEGYIDVQTEFGKGTKFMVYLPAISLLSKTTLQTAKTETSEGRGELILLVEDDLAVLEVTRVMLENLGYRVITAPNGRQALEIYADHHDEIALVLTDMTMPEMGGVILAQSLQAKYPAIKVIALTGYPLEAESKELLDQGIVDWLQKPLNRYQLAQTIRRSLTIEPRNAVRSADR
jgi:GAF domain-containing protein/CheY-like chemotaxis protein